MYIDQSMAFRWQFNSPVQKKYTTLNFVMFSASAHKVMFLCTCTHTDYSGLSAELRSLPLRCDTLRVQQRKTQLEVKLAEIEDAIKIFSRQKVFIKLNE